MKHQIYCDMDGVLVNFCDAAIKKVNETINDKSHRLAGLARRAKREVGRDYLEIGDLEKYSDSRSRAASSYMYALLERDQEFWANLEWKPGGKEIWDFIEPFNPVLLTSPMDKKGCNECKLGKREWIDKNLSPEQPVIYEHAKWKYAKDGDACNLLIDDFIDKVSRFRDEGGIAVHHEGDIEETLNGIADYIATHMHAITVAKAMGQYGT